MRKSDEIFSKFRNAHTAKDDEQKVIEMREKIDLTEQANRKKKVLSAAAVAVIVSDTGD